MPGAPAPQPTDALSWGWNKFTANAAQIILAVAVLIVGFIVLEILVYFVVLIPLSGENLFLTLVAAGISSAVFFILISLVQAGIARASLAVTEGRPFTMNDVLSTDNLANVLVASLLTGLIVGVGSILCYIPGLIAAFLLSYTLFFVVGKGQSGVEAIKSSFALTTTQLGPTLVYWILAAIVVFVGFLVCFVGTFVALPVAILGQAWMFRRLQGEPVAA